eukprot:c8682_g1_i1.p1 GENE.c8682_g1_i1~~c8682_g1_i1.p1  ORF type:complete len:1390 (-),score=317.37 c8682_g1_i1:54-3851(-)
MDALITTEGEDGLLKMAAISGPDKKPAIPGAMLSHEKVQNRRLLREEMQVKVMNNKMWKKQEEMSDEEKMIQIKFKDILFNQGKEIYAGYVDDPRNTDNAWMETVVTHYHLSMADAKLVTQLMDPKKCWWEAIETREGFNHGLDLFASHQEYVELAVHNIREEKPLPHLTASNQPWLRCDMNAVIATPNRPEPEVVEASGICFERDKNEPVEFTLDEPVHLSVLRLTKPIDATVHGLLPSKLRVVVSGSTSGPETELRALDLNWKGKAELLLDIVPTRVNFERPCRIVKLFGEPVSGDRVMFGKIEFAAMSVESQIRKAVSQNVDRGTYHQYKDIMKILKQTDAKNFELVFRALVGRNMASEICNNINLLSFFFDQTEAAQRTLLTCLVEGCRRDPTNIKSINTSLLHLYEGGLLQRGDDFTMTLRPRATGDKFRDRIWGAVDPFVKWLENTEQVEQSQQQQVMSYRLRTLFQQHQIDPLLSSVCSFVDEQRRSVLLRQSMIPYVMDHITNFTSLLRAISQSKTGRKTILSLSHVTFEKVFDCLANCVQFVRPKSAAEIWSSERATIASAIIEFIWTMSTYRLFKSKTHTPSQVPVIDVLRLVYRPFVNPLHTGAAVFIRRKGNSHPMVSHELLLTLLDATVQVRSHVSLSRHTFMVLQSLQVLMDLEISQLSVEERTAFNIFKVMLNPPHRHERAGILPRLNTGTTVEGIEMTPRHYDREPSITEQALNFVDWDHVKLFAISDVARKSGQVAKDTFVKLAVGYLNTDSYLPLVNEILNAMIHSQNYGAIIANIASLGTHNKAQTELLEIIQMLLNPFVKMKQSAEKTKLVFTLLFKIEQSSSINPFASQRETQVLLTVLKTFVNRSTDPEDKGFNYYDYHDGAVKPLELPSADFVRHLDRQGDRNRNLRKDQLAVLDVDKFMDTSQCLVSEFLEDITEHEDQQRRDALQSLPLLCQDSRFYQGLRVLYNLLEREKFDSEISLSVTTILAKFVGHGQCTHAENMIYRLLADIDHQSPKFKAHMWIVCEALCAFVLFKGIDDQGEKVDGARLFISLDGMDKIDQALRSAWKRVQDIDETVLATILSGAMVLPFSGHRLDLSVTSESEDELAVFELVSLLRVIRGFIHDQQSGVRAFCVSTLSDITIRSCLWLVANFRKVILTNSSIQIETFVSEVNQRRPVLSASGASSHQHCIHWDVKCESYLSPLRVDALELCTQILFCLSKASVSVTTDHDLSFDQLYSGGTARVQQVFTDSLSKVTEVLSEL